MDTTLDTWSASNATDRIQRGSCLYTPRINGWAQPGFAVRSIAAAAELQALLERDGHNVAWNSDNGFASSNYLPPMAQRDLELELHRLDAKRYQLPDRSL